MYGEETKLRMVLAFKKEIASRAIRLDRHGVHWRCPDEPETETGRHLRPVCLGLPDKVEFLPTQSAQSKLS